MTRSRLSAGQARRIAMAATGLDRERPAAEPDARHFRRVINQLGLLQLDYVNVLVPAHFLVLWSRLGAYDRRRFEQYVYGKREFTEQWAHEASIIPSRNWVLLEHRRRAYRLPKNNPLRQLPNRSAYLRSVLDQVKSEGSVTANDLPAVPGPRRKPGEWHRPMPRWALEYHFARGALAVASRQPNFQRVFDLPERLLPPDVLTRSIDKADAQRDLLKIAADAMGIATLQDLADYFRMSPREVSPRVAELVESGAITAVAVQGWHEPAYLAAGARLPRSISGASLLSPFDPVVWFRPRAERLFNFKYRIEIYVPAAKRKWGYYVLPFRLGDQIVARVDLKADRKRSNLRVLAVHEEGCVDRRECVRHLAGELRSLQRWLALERVDVSCTRAVARQLRMTL